MKKNNFSSVTNSAMSTSKKGRGTPSRASADPPSNHEHLPMKDKGFDVVFSLQNSTRKLGSMPHCAPTRETERGRERERKCENPLQKY